MFSAPLAAFIPPAPIEVTTADRDGYRLRYGGYRIGQYHVWGATAGILGRLGRSTWERSRNLGITARFGGSI